MVNGIILGFLVIASAEVNSLECGNDSGLNITELQMMLNSCTYKTKSSSEDTGKDKASKNRPRNGDYDSFDYDDDSYSYINEDSADDRSASSSKLPAQQDSELKSNFSGIHKALEETTIEIDDPKLKPIKSGRCIFHCIFKKLKVVDGDEFPDHNKVSEDIIRNTKNNELRDFLQDSVDECFQLTQEAGGLDVCDFSLNFFKCLAEKGMANCADWPVGDTPLSDMF